MKKKKFESKLSFKKSNISNLGNINGGYIAPYETNDGNCDDGGGGSGGSGGGGGPYSGQTCGNCITNNHPVSDPLHCRTCHDAC